VVSKLLDVQSDFGYSPIVLLAGRGRRWRSRPAPRQGKKVAFFICLFDGGAVVNGILWLCLSSGAPRYALIGLFLFWSATSCVAFIARAAWPQLDRGPALGGLRIRWISEMPAAGQVRLEASIWIHSTSRESVGNREAADRAREQQTICHGLVGNGE
jgi:hypothetical protein